MAGCHAQPRTTAHLRRRGERSLLLALVVSAALHIIGGAASTRYGIAVDALNDQRGRSAWHATSATGSAMVEQSPADDADRPLTQIPDTYAAVLVEIEPPPPPPAPEPPMLDLRLGLDGSKQPSEAMIGFLEPTEHQAPLSEIDQPALSTQPAGTAPTTLAAGSQTAPTDQSPSTPEPLAQVGPPSPEQLEAVRTLTPRGNGEAELEPVEPTYRPSSTVLTLGTPADPARPTEPTSDKTLGALGDQLREAREKITKGTQSPQHASPPPHQHSAPAPSPTVGNSGDAPSTIRGTTGDPSAIPALVSDKESDPSSKVDPIKIRFGQTVAGEGIEIVTRKLNRPVFTKLTRVIAWPSNPTLNATFDAAGKVVEVKIIKSSGFDDVDEPVRNMVYSWRARGPKLSTFAASNPDGQFTLKFTILLQ